MATHASGPFEVELIPQPPTEGVGDPGIGRLAIAKRYRGDLEAIGRGEMLAHQGGVPGSAGYVAIERVTGTLHGRDGGFVLQHSGVMDRGTPELTVTVVPDSGTGALAGIAGRMAIRIADGKHSYDFEYTLPEAS